jgi:signal transduction histidine kinase
MDDSATIRWPHLGLSGKLLVLTILFVMLAEVLIYVPSVANFRLNWLRDRLAAAHTAALVLDAAPTGMVPEGVTRQVLDSIGAKAVALKTDTTRRLLAVSDSVATVDHEYDVRGLSPYGAIMDAMATLFRSHDDLMRVMGPAPHGGEYVEIVLPEKPLREAMWRFSVNILLLSLVISVIAATLVYLSLLFLLVGPMRRLTAKMTAFHRDPENPEAIMTPSGRRDEIGTAERELAAMQRDLVSMLHQKDHLAALGLAVSKISHDLRNLLASAQLFSDRLSSLPDPTVQRFAPRLMQALERAISFCQSTLSYGQAKEPPPDRRMVALDGLLDEVCHTLGLGPEARIQWVASVERSLMVDADPDQLFRALLNIARNAVQALESRAPNDPGRDQIRFIGRREGAVVVIQISDTGPGLPEKARAHLFEAFQGSSRQGGTGLGLVIAAELIRAHGGEIRLVEGTVGATFRITIPDRAVDIGAHRSERQRA